MFRDNQTEDIINVDYERYTKFSKIIYSIRAISIFLIVLIHIGSWFSNIRQHSKDFILMIFEFGAIGVDFFFFLSGMLLVITILKRGVENHSWSDWYKKRIIRIFPPYWIMLLIIIFTISINYIFDLNLILINLSGLQMIPIVNINFDYIHFIYWYLSAILICYILFPLMFNAIRKNFIATTIIGIVLFILVILFFDDFLSISFFISKNLLNFKLDKFIFAFFITKYFVFFFGIAFGYWIGNNNMANLEKIYKIKIGISLFIILIFLLLSSFFIYLTISYQRWMFPLVTFFSIAFFLFFFNKFYKINRFLTYFGKRSYEIYLVHSFLFIIIYFIAFDLFFLPSNLISDLIILPIFLFLIFTSSYFLNRILNKILHQKKNHSYILILAISFFLYALISIFIPFYIDFYLALFIYTSILIVLILIHKIRGVILRKSEEIQINEGEKESINKTKLGADL